MDFSIGDKVILIYYLLFPPTKKEATIKSVEHDCYIVQKEFGTMRVDLDGTIPAWGAGSCMKKVAEQNESPGY